jgi:glycopeptide antibiotics resistance protein
LLGWATQFLTDARTWGVFACLALLSLATTWPLARRTGWPVWATAGMLLSAAVIATLTLAPAPGHPVGGPDLSAAGECARTLFDLPAAGRALMSTAHRGERIGNMLMFLPASAFAVLACRRPVAVAAIGAASPVVIELAQAMIAAGRDCAVDDWVNNAVGAVLGVLLAVTVLRTAPVDRARADSR